MKEQHTKNTPKDKLEIPRDRDNLQCKHCADHIHRDAYCEECKKFMVDQCCACHDELVHDKIKMQNTNTHGGRKMRDSGKARNKKFGWTPIESRRKGD